MVAGISAINLYNQGLDAEYMRIVAELKRLGITPSGNKSIDTAKLEKAKAELITKISNKVHEENKNNLHVNAIEPVDGTQNNQRAELETQRLGAMTVAELNKIYFGLL